MPDKKDNHMRKQAQYPKDGGSFLIENIKIKKAKETQLPPTNLNLNHMRSGEKNEKYIVDLIKSSGYIVVDKSKDNVSKDEIYKTHQNRMISNHEENRSNKMNYEESSTYKIEESSNILMINKTIEESTGSYFNKLKRR